MTETTFATAVRHIIELLVAGRYDEIADITKTKRLDAHSIKKAITEYGRNLVMPPGESFKQMDIIEVKDAVPAQWSVRFHLWTYEEGRSDLSLELTLIEQGEGYIIELDGIHVL